MRDVLSVKVIQCFQELVHYIFCFAFTQSTFTFFVTYDVGEQVTAGAQLEKNMPNHMHLDKLKRRKDKINRTESGGVLPLQGFG